MTCSKISKISFKNYDRNKGFCHSVRKLRVVNTGEVLREMFLTNCNGRGLELTIS
jgi:hypothetical protein